MYRRSALSVHDAATARRSDERRVGQVCSESWGPHPRQGISLLRLLFRAVADTRHFPVAHAIETRQVHCRLTRRHARARLGNQRALLRKLRLEGVDLGLTGLNFGPGLIQRRPQVPVVDTRQYLASLD